MNRTTLPAPPNPDMPAFSGNPQDWMRAAYLWMQQVKGRIETDTAVNIKPVAPFAVSSYTAVSTVTGTDAMSNFVATLVTAMQTKGMISPTSERTTP